MPWQDAKGVATEPVKKKVRKKSIVIHFIQRTLL
jgi:hypothetical protein